MADSRDQRSWMVDSRDQRSWMADSRDQRSWKVLFSVRFLDGSYNTVGLFQPMRELAVLKYKVWGVRVQLQYSGSACCCHGN